MMVKLGKNMCTTKHSNRVYRWAFDQGVRARVGPAFQFKDYNGKIPTIGKSSQCKLAQANRKGTSGSFHSYRANVNFQIAVALAGLHKVI